DPSQPLPRGSRSCSLVRFHILSLSFFYFLFTLFVSLLLLSFSLFLSLSFSFFLFLSLSFSFFHFLSLSFSSFSSFPFFHSLSFVYFSSFSFSDGHILFFSLSLFLLTHKLISPSSVIFQASSSRKDDLSFVHESDRNVLFLFPSLSLTLSFSL